MPDHSLILEQIRLSNPTAGAARISAPDPTHVEVLRKSLALIEEALPEISDANGRQTLTDHADKLRKDIQNCLVWEDIKQRRAQHGGYD